MMREYDLGLVNKNELINMIHELQKGVEEERRMRDKLFAMYENQIAMQDAEIRRLQNALVEAEQNLYYKENDVSLPF